MNGNVGNHTNFDSHVDAVVDWFGPTNFLIMDEKVSISLKLKIESIKDLFFRQTLVVVKHHRQHYLISFRHTTLS